MCEIILSGSSAQMKADRRMRENEHGVHLVMRDGDDEVNDYLKSSSLTSASSQRGSIPGEVIGSQEASAAIFPLQRGTMPGGVIGGPLEARDPFVGVVNRHERLIDDIMGQPLDPELCRIARQKEIYYIRSKCVWGMR